MKIQLEGCVSLFVHISSPKLLNGFWGEKKLLESTQSPRPCVTFLNILAFYGDELFAPCPPHPTQSWRTSPCWLSITAFPVYLQLPSMCGGLSPSPTMILQVP